jgi:hypothetical protein
MRAPLRLVLLGVAPFALSLATASCGSPDARGAGDDVATAATALAIVPGEGIGVAKIGMTYADLEALIGKPATPSGFMRMFMATYPDERIEVVFSSPNNEELTPDSTIVAVGTVSGGSFTGPVVPGQTAIQIESALGVPPDRADGFGFYPEGISIEYAPDGSAKRIGVYVPYTLALTPPEMQPAKTRLD